MKGLDRPMRPRGGFLRTLLLTRSPFPYETADHEEIPCDLCGSADCRVLSTKDRNYLDVRACICTRCGLIFLNPRMTKEWYGRYYQEEYRAQMARFKGRFDARPEEEDLAGLYRRGTRHGLALAALAQPYLRRGLTIEVGSSAGGVLNGFKQALDVEVRGIEPSGSEAQWANRQGIPTDAALIESTACALPPAANILCVQSLNHLLSPRFFLGWAHGHLDPQGCLLLEVMNFRHVLRRFQCLRRAIQIDHTYMFVPEVLRHFVIAAGFDILWMEQDEDSGPARRSDPQRAGLPGYHIRLVARKSGRAPFAHIPEMEGVYEHTMQSLESIPLSPIGYFFRHEARYLARRIKSRLRRRGSRGEAGRG